MELNKKELAEKAKEKRIELIRSFYENNKYEILDSAERGYRGYRMSFSSLDEDLKSALRIEKENLSEIVSEVDIELKTSKLLITGGTFISGVAFKW